MSRNERIVLAAILAVALALRLAFILGQRSDVLFASPQLDEKHYVDYASALVHGMSHEQDALPYWQPPGIVYVLCATFKIAGPSLLVPRVLSALVSVASCFLLFALGRRLFSTRIGLAAAAILAVHGVVVFETYELLPPTYALFFDLAAILLLVRGDSWRLALGAGLALGASALFAATVLPCALVGVIVLRRRRLAVLAFVAGVILPIAPVTARNWVRSGQPVLISANAGLNFYLGNNAHYRGTMTLRPGRHWEALVAEGDSSYFAQQGLAFYRDAPLDAAALLLRKLYLFVHGAEIARDTDIYAVRHDSRLLAVLVSPGPLHVPDGLLIPLALVGLVALWPERRRLAVPLGFLAVQAVVVSAFFVSARYRLPSIPLFALLAAAGVPRLVQRIPARPLWIAATCTLVVAIGIVFNLPAWETRYSLAAEREMFRGLAYASRNEPRAAAGAFARATELDPGSAASWFELGNTYDAMANPAQAIDAWAHAAQLDPWDSRARRREAVARSRLGDLDGAIRALETLIATAAREPAHYAPDHLNLAFTLVRRGEPDRAIAHLRAAAIDPDYLRGALPRMMAGSGDIHSAAFLDAVAQVTREIGAEPR
jgi:tetratricopeptide (TPR) repeat protein